jgi:16S rRNA (guanine966-N2)-methyltransferase
VTTVVEAGRVIAGTARGTRLVAPGPGTRPLGDRVKQTLFAILEPGLDGAAVLDLCAGSGAAGIEALSRGAARAVFVEREAAAVRSIVENLRRTGLDGPGARTVTADALRYVAGGAAAADGPFDIVVVDPPYADATLLGQLLEVLGADVSGRLLAHGGTVVAKHFWRDGPPATIGLLASVRDRRFGETGLTFYRREGG